MNTTVPSYFYDKPQAHAEHVVRLAKQLADGNRSGVLATVDEHGMPHVRFMATVSLQEFPHLYALTSPTSRKMEHIQANPNVTWMFSTDTSSMIINLSGKAKILTDSTSVNRIWQLIENKTNAYFMVSSSGVAVIDTVIEDIECTIPRYDLHYPPKAEDFSLLRP